MCSPSIRSPTTAVIRKLAQDRVNTDPGQCRELHVLKAQGLTNGASNGIYGYDFNYQNAPYYFPQMPNAFVSDGLFSASRIPHRRHSVRVRQVARWKSGGEFRPDAISPANNQPRELQGAEITLSNQIVAAWTNFAKTGNPNGAGLPTWPVFTTSAPTFLKQDIPNSTETEAAFRATYHCDFWDPLQTYPTD